MTLRLRTSLAALAIASAAMSARAGDGLPTLPGSVPEPGSPESVPSARSGPIASTLAWYSIPRRARSVAKNMAKSEKAAITRCVAVEEDAQVSYEIHASHRTGLFRRDDFVLMNMTEPKATAEKRAEERSLRGRWASLRKARTEQKNPKTVKYPPHSFGGSSF